MVESVLKTNLPKHLVIIPDGNVRWAQKHKVSPLEGYAAGIKALQGVLREVDSLDGIGVVTVWGFSTDNWARPEEETVGVMTTVQELIQQQGEDLAQRGYRFRHIGRRDRLPEGLVADIEKLEERTAANTEKTIVMGFDYGGRDEILRAVNKTKGETVDGEGFRELLDTAGLPDPDLIIRTSGEYRTSGIYPYQGVYAEFVSSPVLMPDFDKREFYRCLEEYSKRQRNFGRRLETNQEPPFSWLNLDKPDFATYMAAVLPVFDTVAQDLITQWRSSGFFKKSRALQEDIDVFEKLLSGGKKLRSAIGLLGFENFSGEEEYRVDALKAILGYELIHNAFLIHDDVEDNASERRGKPSVHEQYRLKHEATGGLVDHAQYGLGVAINTGSLGVFRALDTLWGINNKPSRIIEAQKWLRDVLEGSLQGQRLDLADVRLDQLTKQYVNQVYHRKTAVYTVIGPMGLGAILAGASRRDLAQLNTFGVNLGIAFQMVDDHLGMFGDESSIGKSVDSDIKEGKKTLHFVEGYRRANDSERTFLEGVWGNRDITPTELDQTKELIDRLGVRKFVLDQAVRLAEKAKIIIPKITYDQTTRAIFEDMAEFIVKRDS